MHSEKIVKSIKKLLPYIKKYRLFCILSPLFMLLEVAMDLLQPHFLKNIIDIGITSGDTHYVVKTSIFMLCAALMGVIGGIGCTVFSTLAAINIGTTVRSALFAKIRTLSLSNIDKLEQGSLITRLTNDIDQLQEAIIMFLRMLVRSPLLVIGSLIMAIVTSPMLSLLLIIIIPLMVMLIAIIHKRGFPLFSLVQKRIDKVNSIIEESLSGIRVIKAFARSDYEEKRFSGVNESLFGRSVAAGFLMATIFPIMMFVINMGIILALYFGGRFVIAGDMQVGRVLAFITYLTQMTNSLTMMGMIIARISRADASAERINDVLETSPEITQKDTTKEIDFTREIVFENVCCGYGEKDVLHDINLTIKPQTRTVIMGETGSGKSSLASLIQRLYDVRNGSIKIGGVDIKDCDLTILRKRVGMVLQQTQLFSGSVSENIGYGKSDATKAEMEEAAKMACAHDFITALVDGYNTQLSQKGINLSGGQKQRIAIARTLISKPDIIIFDDCTSAVDMATERKIMKAIDEWEHPCTQIIIAQRINAAKTADMVVVLEKGKICGTGTHDELLESCETYKNIALSQSDMPEAML